MSNDDVEAIRERGYCIIPDLYSINDLTELLGEIKSNKISTGEGKDIPRLNLGTDMVYSPFLESKKFFDLFRHSEIDAILRTCLNDKYYKGLDGRPNYILRSMLCRSSREALPWHIDSFFPYEGPNIISMQVAIPLERFSASNGPTLLMPGSHLSGAYAPQSFEDSTDIVELHANPGDVVIWDSRLWHAARENTSGESRWSVISTFTRWWIKQNYQYGQRIRDAKKTAEYSDNDLIVLGCASESPYSHHNSVDLKGGLERIALSRL